MNTRTIKPMDIIYVETKAEEGHALVEAVIEKGRSRTFDYVPLAGKWQKGRVYREPVTARQITGHWSRRNGGNA